MDSADSVRPEAVAEGGEVDGRSGAGGHRVARVARWIWDWTRSLAVAFLIFIGIRTFLVEAFRIPTGSMERTLLVGDFLLVNKAVYGAQIPGTHAHLPGFGDPQRGDVIVFIPPHDPGRHYVKRLVGVAGDTLSMRDKVLYRDRIRVEEPYAQHTDFLGDPRSRDMLWQREYLPAGVDPRSYRPSRDNWGPIVVPQGGYFVLGDNRDDSEDSRYWGFVDPAAVEGRPMIVYYSFDPRSMAPFPWLTEVRWARIGGAIH